MSTAQVAQRYKVAESLKLAPSLGMQFELKAGDVVVFSRYRGRHDAFTVEGSDTVSPEWAIAVPAIKRILTREDFLRFRKEFNV